MKLSKGTMVTVSFMLFSLFFGAGNLIFPPFLGQSAANQTIPAILGFLITAVILPILGVVVVARFDGLDRLSRKVGKYFALVFTVLIYLSIGPGLGIPRAASVPFEMAVAPYLPEHANLTLFRILYSLVFFLIALLRIFSTPLKTAFRILCNTLLGFLALWGVNLTAGVTGIALGLNLYGVWIAFALDELTRGLILRAPIYGSA